MADFCRQCEIEMFNPKNLTQYGILDNEVMLLLCEGCGGSVWVDKYGNKQSDVYKDGESVMNVTKWTDEPNSEG